MTALAARLVDALYPPRCAACETLTDAAHGLCPACWADTAFITGLACAACGMPLPGQPAGADVLCDACIAHPPGWDRGRAAILYEGAGRRVILSLKHGDRLDLAPVMAKWLARAAPDLLARAEILAPVPLHWTRLFRRSFNQSAEIARHLPRAAGRRLVPDLVTRIRRTPSTEGMTRARRIEALSGAFAVAPRHRTLIAGRRVLILDDVMTTGATLSAVAEACRAAGASDVDVLVLARVALG
jgi:predicted amidophosphoribosyltransferase